MRLLVCGSRDWDDEKILNIVLTGIMHSYESLVIIEGEARGADTMARVWAQKNGLEFVKFPANWRTHADREFCTRRCRDSETCYGAGPRRNQQMLDEGHPNGWLAFKDHLNITLSHGGTEDMITRCKKLALPGFVVGRGPYPDEKML